MSFSKSTPKPEMKSFVTESELEEKRQVRQAEWEKVRKADQPLECPEIPLDNRTLFDRLREQKLKDEEEKEEAKKMKNFVRGLESDEVEFLDYVDDIYTKRERDKLEQERAVLKEFKITAMNTSGTSGPPVSPATINSKRKEAPGADSSSKKRTQKDLLASVIRVKRTDSQSKESSSTSDAKPTPAVVLSPKDAAPSKLGLLVAYGSSGSDSD
ncbi:hypothetical protein BV898_03828 [Hypsibius exemplaris]|uniref:FAM192A/Fyv6 N-terminal domain-containing protein n=1 Tax=Hypsibius exemplaris TaxID=2072580 RepID=A0A1W0X4N6_HYPEX|nr:hypothetical protein BV898_03828 [Hypsibius exemplaris]